MYLRDYLDQIYFGLALVAMWFPTSHGEVNKSFEHFHGRKYNIISIKWDIIAWTSDELDVDGAE